MNENILFDNIYIGHDVEQAKAFQKETFDIKKPQEEKAEKAAQGTSQDKKSPLDLAFLADPVHYVKEKVALFVELVQRNPVDAIKFVPEVAGAIGLGLLAILVAIFAGSSAAAPSKEQIKAKAKKAADAVQKTKNDVAEAVATGAENAKDEVNKRSTRSGAQ